MKTVWLAIAIALVLSSTLSHAQNAGTAPEFSGSRFEKPPELDHRALNALDPKDVSGRMNVFQDAIDRAKMFLRRQRAQRATQPDATPAPPSQ